MMTYFFFKWLHILSMTYWLAGEWGVFTTTRCVVDPSLTFAERMRHLESAYRIDVLARAGIILLLPLGLQMGAMNFGIPVPDTWLKVMWVFVIGWLSLMLAAFFKRGTETGIRLTKLDEYVRYFIIPALFFVSIWSLFFDGPVELKWYATKMGIFGILLCIGLFLRWVMRDWFYQFKLIQENGPNPAVEKLLALTMSISRKVAYCYWVLIGTMAFLGVAKPF